MGYTNGVTILNQTIPQRFETVPKGIEPALSSPCNIFFENLFWLRFRHILLTSLHPQTPL